MPRPSTRLLFDELASPRVARALAQLGFRVTHVGAPEQPPLGSEDATILTAAKATNQVVVTNNHDMIALCADEGESVIWLDPRDKDMTLQAQTRMCLDQIADWDRELRNAGAPICVQVFKRSYRVISLSTARRLAIERGKRRAREYRRRIVEQEPGGLLDEGGDPV